MPLAIAILRIWPILRTLIGLDEAPLTVMSCDTTAASRPCDPAVAADLAVGRRAVPVRARLAAREHADLEERARVEQ